MANLSNPQLSIRLISNTSNTDTTANVDVALTPFESFLVNSGGLRILLKCKLRGDDSGFNGSDDDLFEFPAQTVAADGMFTFQGTVSRGTLDEDSTGNDEIYAQFTLQSTEQSFPLVVQANSPIISGDF